MRRQREDELARKLRPELFLEPVAGLDSLRVEALQVRSEEPCSSMSRLLGKDVHLGLYIGGRTPLA